MKKNVVGIILARGGSKGVPGKNLRYISGQQLIGFAIQHANESDLVTRIVVSTDSEDIANCAKRYGAEVPFMRPAHLSGDEATLHSGYEHAIGWLQEHENYKADIVVMLRATTIFRPPDIIDRCVQRLLDDPSLDSAFAGYGTGGRYWRKLDGKWQYIAGDIDFSLSRQQREREGPVVYEERVDIACASRSEVILTTNHYVGENVEIIPCHDERSFCDINDFFDLWLADKIIKEWNPVRHFPSPMREQILFGELD